MTIARKKTIITAAVAVSVLAAEGIATPTGQMPIASAPTRHVSIPTGPSLASLATPNTLLAAVSSPCRRLRAQQRSWAELPRVAPLGPGGNAGNGGDAKSATAGTSTDGTGGTGGVAS